MIEIDKPMFRVAVTLPVSGTYVYSAPQDLASTIKIGHAVFVRFKNRKVVGYVLEKEPGSIPEVDEIKDILEIIDPEPFFHATHVPFFRWVSEYYVCPIGKLLQAILPNGLNSRSIKLGRLTDKGIEAIDNPETLSEDKKILKWIRSNPAKPLKTQSDHVFRLRNRGWIQVENQTGGKKAGPLTRKFVRIKEGGNPEICEMKDMGSWAKNEEDFFSTISCSEGVSLADIRSRYSNGENLVNKWIKKGVIEKYDKIVFRDPSGDIIIPSPEPKYLFDQQKSVINKISEYLDQGKFSAYLLHGVTGSGKTEVYYRIIKENANRGKQAILMVPEIALAIYMHGLFRSRLGNRLAVYHSGLSLGERYDQWMKIARGDVDLVIGARSALFSPFPKLGLIIVDEEYDSSYKQEKTPRYQARDSAVVRGRMEKALVLLGSGTPAIQSFQNAVTKKYHLLTMSDRIEKRPLPNIEIVDMKEIVQKGKSYEILSPMLRKSLEDNLKRGKQAILFLNRRGYSRIHLCRACGESVKCPNCDLTLTYHHGDRFLMCHYCGFHSQPRQECPLCGHGGMRTYGFGTEKVEIELKTIFPEARIARMDRDSTRKKGHSLKLLKAFREREIDILVGTQMITKGYDFPHVTLVGVIAADLSLTFPDFRAGERTFQILSQVAGRAGRGDQKGEVIIQTFNPDHYAITTAKEHDYETFFKKEQELRKQLEYPPFSYLACLRFQGNDRAATEKKAGQIGNDTRSLLKRWPKRGREVQVLGPVEAPLAKLKGKYRHQILIKSKSAELLHYLLKEVDIFTKKNLAGSGVQMIMDVDPYQML